MPDRWIVDIGVSEGAAGELAGEVVAIVLGERGFAPFLKRGCFAIEDVDGSLAVVLDAIQVLARATYRRHILSLHVYRLSGAVHDFLEVVRGETPKVARSI